MTGQIVDPSGRPYSWGERSLRIRRGLHPKLLTVFDAALYYRDIALLEGHRDEDTQNFYYTTGKSKVQYPNSKHNVYPSRAVDAIPYPFNPEWWNVERYFYVWCEWGSWVKGLAAGKGIKLRWGFDWDGDFDLKDQTFYDGPHFELCEEEE